VKFIQVFFEESKEADTFIKQGTLQIGKDFNATLKEEDYQSSTLCRRVPLGPYILPHFENLIDTGGTAPKPAFTSYHQRGSNWSKSRID